MKTFKVLAVLLSYPDEDLVAAVPELREALDAERALDSSARSHVERLLVTIEETELIELQEHYVSLFDRVRSLSLHLFEHVHGESRDRGQALVDLKALYERHGFVMKDSELPDYLPAFLEFVAHVGADEGRNLLKEVGRILEGISARLAKRGSAYAAAFQALLALSGHTPAQPVAISDADIRREDDPAALDAAWAEEPAFRPGTPLCGAAQAPQSAVVKFYKGVAA